MMHPRTPGTDRDRRACSGSIRDALACHRHHQQCAGILLLALGQVGFLSLALVTALALRLAAFACPVAFDAAVVALAVATRRPPSGVASVAATISWRTAL